MQFRINNTSTRPVYIQIIDQIVTDQLKGQGEAMLQNAKDDKDRQGWG